MKECKLPVHTILMPSIAFDAIKTFYCSIYLLLRFVEYSPSYRLVIPCDCDVYIFFRKSNSGIEEEVRFVLEVLVLLEEVLEVCNFQFFERILNFRRTLCSSLCTGIRITRWIFEELF